MMRRRALGVIALLLLGAGCGYSWRGSLPPHIKTVGVPVFANRTQWPNIEAAMTAAVVNAFATDGRLRVVSPSTPNDGYWMIQDAIASPDPVIFLKPKAKYWMKGEVDTSARALIASGSTRRGVARSRRS